MRCEVSLRRMGTGTAVAAAALLLALGSLTGSASAANIQALKLEVAGTGLVGGAPLQIASANFTLANSFWSMTCTESITDAKVGANGLAKNDFEPISSGSFGGGSPNDNGLCQSNYEFVTNYEPEEASELVLNRKGQALWRFPRFKLIPLADVEKPAGHKEACDIISNQIAGTFPLSETPQPLVITFSAARMHLKGSHGAECGTGSGASPALSATLTFTSRGSQVEAVLFTHH